MNTQERESYSIAEEEAARALCDAIGRTLGFDFFIAHTAAAPLCATFQFDDVPRELGAQFSVRHALRSVALNASLRITAARRGAVAETLTAILAEYPFNLDGCEHLECLMIAEDGISAIQQVTVAEGDSVYDAWQTDVGFVVSFKIR